MGELAKDAKDLLIGKDGSDKEPKDFKEELQDAIKDGIINKATGTLLLEARGKVDESGKKMIKRQEDGVRKIKDSELYDIPEQEVEDKKEKEEKERKRKEREIAVARQMQEKIKANSKSIENKSKDLGEK